MLRKFSPVRLAGYPEIQRKIGIVSRHRKYPVLLACLSSGLLYRNVVTVSHPNLHRHLPVYPTLPTADSFVFYSTKGNSNESPDYKRIERMAMLRSALEKEIPKFFDQKFLQVPSDFFDAETCMYYQGKDGRIHSFSSRALLNVVLILARAYYTVRSSFQRVQVLSILSDPEKWEVEVSFRVILIPGPSVRDSRLPSDLLWRKLESEAKWHDFRATFSISEAAKISEVRVTKFMPPQRPPEMFRNLKQLRLARGLSPVLSGSRQLPSPTPFISPFFLSSSSLQFTFSIGDTLSALTFPDSVQLGSWLFIVNPGFQYSHFSSHPRCTSPNPGNLPKPHVSYHFPVVRFERNSLHQICHPSELRNSWAPTKDTSRVENHTLSFKRSSEAISVERLTPVLTHSLPKHKFLCTVPFLTSPVCFQ